MNREVTRIRKIEPKDIMAVIDLMNEFAEFENLSGFLEVTFEKLNKAMFGNDSFVDGLIAFVEETPVAYAICFPFFSSFRGQKGIYLEDLFVKTDYRKTGIGKMLIREIARNGLENGASRMDFQVLKWNAPAIEFYKKHGAQIDTNERHFKFTDQAFLRLAE